MKRFYPFSITAVGFAAFLAWAWIGMSSMDYSTNTTGDGRKTAGWFVLGLPMLVPIALFSTMPFSMIARRGRPAIAWFAMVVVFGVVIWFAYVQSTPQARLAWALGVEVPADTNIICLRENDSFNDGITTIGACTADNAFVGDLVAHHSLKESMTGGYISPYMPDTDIPEDGIGYRNDRLTCYHDSESGTLYFVRRYSDPRP
ncbi:hypothetical protein [Rhodopirellula sp. P2]|uniref:hypothetical protein n=1 Tax=Rhodopirellula sp. P2 TaxID=2127060 RepID=UPI0023681C3C|nr:hypothetical protein [Rhodopirellula sp. P2]WDQ15119.1 hypothetical protein PSR62_15895 [Rhodopirellula sp. P2]